MQDNLTAVSFKTKRKQTSVNKEVIEVIEVITYRAAQTYRILTSYLDSGFQVRHRKYCK